MLSTIVRTVAPIAFSCQSKYIQKLSNKLCCGLAWSGVACVEWHGSLPWHGKPLRGGSKRTLRTCLMSKKPFYLQSQMMCSNSMKFGVLYAKKTRPGGCGRRCAAEPAKSSPLPLETEARATCLRLWQAIPHEYKHCHTFSDFWHAYQYVFPAETHHCVGKETGETAHMERWNNTLRQRVGRYVRQTLSFSKSDEYHDMITKWFIVQYNLGLSLTS
jgi:IS1 family transposase